MTHYLEFTLQGNKRMPVPALMSKLLHVVHLTLVRLQTSSIGVSFPAYGTTLGNILRVHGEPHQLKLFVLNVDALPTGVKVTDILAVPDGAEFANFYRIRPSKQNSKLQAGLKSGHITDAKSYIKKMCEEVLNEPFFYSQSTSTGQGYKRFVARQAASPQDRGVFDSFGLSKTASVPVF